MGEGGGLRFSGWSFLFYKMKSVLGVGAGDRLHNDMTVLNTPTMHPKMVKMVRHVYVTAIKS